MSRKEYKVFLFYPSFGQGFSKVKRTQACLNTNGRNILKPIITEALIVKVSSLISVILYVWQDNKDTGLYLRSERGQITNVYCCNMPHISNNSTLWFILSSISRFCYYSVKKYYGTRNKYKVQFPTETSVIHDMQVI